MLNLGRVFLIFTLFINLAFSKVSLTLDTPVVYEGDLAQFSIVADGNKVKFPDIDEVGGYAILGTSSSQNISIINGAKSKTVSKIYAFKPLKSIEIPSFEVLVDGKLYKTEPANLEVVKQTPNKTGDEFMVELKTNKNKLILGDHLKLDVVFKIRADVKFDKFDYEFPKIEHFLVKQLNDVKNSSENGYITQTISFLLFPQQAGSYEISPLKAYFGNTQKDQFSDPFFSSFFGNIKWKDTISNSLNLEVLPLPGNVQNFGKFSINATVDKTKVNANEPVNLTLKINGDGNIEDIKKFDLKIDNALIYPNNPEIKNYLNNGLYGGEFLQKFAIVGDRNFTIPAINFSYFDKDLNATKTISSQEIKIEVLNSNLQNSSQAQNSPKILVSDELKSDNLNEIKDENLSNLNTKTSKKYLILTFILGFILGIISMILFSKINFKKEKKQKPIIEKLKAAKSDKELFDLLLPYIKTSKFIDETLNLLEENLYKNASNKIDKRKIIEYFLNI